VLIKLAVTSFLWVNDDCCTAYSYYVTSVVRSWTPRLSPRRQHKFHGGEVFHGSLLLGTGRGLLWVTERGLLSLKVMMWVQKWISPSRNLLGSGMEIVALNCLVVEKTAFLCTRCCVPGTCMRQTNRRTKKQTNKQSSLDKCRCHDVFTGNQFTRTSRCHDRYGQFGL